MKRLLPILAACALFAGCATPVGYLAKQGRYLLRDSTGTRSVESLLADPDTPEEARVFLERARDIKRFAVETVGLEDNRNYTRYREINRAHLVYVVQACDAVSFTPFLWRYPLVGKLPYRGYYERPDADAEAARLAGEGYDVIVRPADAFSTLGITRDPLYSYMARYSAFELASLIIHEQTHATVFVKGEAQFNEALATLVGEEGAFAWLERRFGADSAEYRQAVDEKGDSDTLSALLHGLARELDEIYSSDRSRERKLALKAEIIARFEVSLSSERFSRFRTEPYRRAGGLEINNALLSLYRLYSDDVPALRVYWREQCGGDLRRLVEAARRLGVGVLG